jgi:hypothetical protein
MPISEPKYRDVRLRIVDPIIVKCRPVLTCLSKLYETTCITSLPGGEPMFPMQSYLYGICNETKFSCVLLVWYYSFVEARTKMSKMKSPL